MTHSRLKGTYCTYTTFSILLISVMFIVTVFLSFIVLNHDQCQSQSIAAKPTVLLGRNPKFAQSRHHLAVLVPYRDRFEELMEFVPYMFRYLSNQNIDHNIFILNQIDKYRFNRASLLNAGFQLTKSNHDYIAMHDVDLLPMNTNLSYAYPETPVHLAGPSFHPRYHYEKFIGGILLINREHFQLVDGLSNRYWGWGLEDDEFYVRLKDAHLNVTRPQNIATGTSDTFRHIHGADRKRDTVKCYNQREVTRRRDRKTGLHDVKFDVESYKNMEIEGAPFTVINIRLYCNFTSTPWCDCSQQKTVSNKKPNR
ncbi:unnamed protein product [Acanthoscelides obtectus]|uniref:Beta-1,4-N-acetylgalactosaminyltransferase n=1 Tax=Acanthoscelides obtectus TaxID=200917 RepID=A0A9P0L4B5_ACAOB|nr:unnamed protein product [Acanthoscelides obtectus]CAK1670652.1 Beta-1,4-galactosyltransferase 7 [Acanthoscelides obtectus]